ncbi:hypothetical protein ACGFRG_05755 [Streptomyces sp. NPDC048696]|uniref:hypothetical protein n=1 Tax=Streptomyces sp. NPDC048696 TaxID=3365585 RepID=UPI003724B79E
MRRELSHTEFHTRILLSRAHKEEKVVAKPLVMGRKEIAMVYNIAPTAVSDRWVPRGTISYEDAVIVSGKPFWPGGLVVDLALPPGSRGRQLDEEALGKLEKAQGAGVRPKVKGELPPLVGAQEYASLFGVDQVHVGQLVKSKSEALPASDYHLSGSHVWLLSTVLESADKTMSLTRKGLWQLDQSVAEALSEGRYDGPGSFIAKRGNYGTGAMSAEK